MTAGSTDGALGALGTLDRRGRSRVGDALPTPEALYDAGLLRAVDVHFARTAARLARVDDPHVLLGLAVASRAPGAGHVCAALDAPHAIVRRESAVAGDAVRWPDVDAWCAALLASPVVHAAGACDDAAPERPLVLDGARLYLARYWRYQRRLCAALAQRAGRLRDDVDADALRAGLARLFPTDGAAPPNAAPDLQRVAAATAVLRALAVVTGGPGTGKTTTVLKVLALLVEQALAAGAAPPRVVLAAPTGKAAARLVDSIHAGLAKLPLDPAVAAHIRPEASTLHRLLGWQPRTPTRFRHDADRPLAADVVVVDECSMVDLSLMAKLVDAVPAHARLVLLGDRDQLASVEAGSILADVCGADGAAPFRGGAAFAARLAAACDAPTLAAPAPAGPASAGPASDGPPPPAIADCVVRLVVSHRFRDDGGIGALARAVNAGDRAAMYAALCDDPTGQVTFVETAAARPDLAALRRLALPAYRAAVQADAPHAALDALDRFRLLAAHRDGAFGVAGLNAEIVRALAGERSLPREALGGGWYHGQPVLVTENDRALELYNGDVGVVLRDGTGTGAGGALRVWFRAGAGRVRAVAPARLPAHETVFAMTVHKSQGSEFDEVVLVLPPAPSPVLTRELLYTGVSRARARVTVVGSRPVLDAAIAERVQRASGLRAALWGA